MTASNLVPDLDSQTADPAPAVRRSGALRLLGGIALVAGPVLFAAGMATSPEAAGDADALYIASLARNATQTQMSALFLHYGNLLMGLGLLAAPALVRGRKGFWPTLIGSVLAVIGFVNLSGMLLSDWWNLSAGTHLTTEQAVSVFQGFKQASLLGFWEGTTPLSLFGPVLVLIGLTRAGVVRWWTVPLLIAGVAGLMTIPVNLPLVTAGAVLVGFTPLALIGLRLVGRFRAGTL